MYKIYTKKLFIYKKEIYIFVILYFLFVKRKVLSFRVLTLFNLIIFSSNYLTNYVL